MGSVCSVKGYDIVGRSEKQHHIWINTLQRENASGAVDVGKFDHNTNNREWDEVIRCNHHTIVDDCYDNYKGYRDYIFDEVTSPKNVSNTSVVRSASQSRSDCAKDNSESPLLLRLSSDQVCSVCLLKVPLSYICRTCVENITHPTRYLICEECFLSSDDIHDPKHKYSQLNKADTECGKNVVDNDLCKKESAFFNSFSSYGSYGDYICKDAIDDRRFLFDPCVVCSRLITGDNYRCRSCPEFIVCVRCYEKERYFHDPSHEMVPLLKLSGGLRKGRSGTVESGGKGNVSRKYSIFDRSISSLQINATNNDINNCNTSSSEYSPLSLASENSVPHCDRKTRRTKVTNSSCNRRKGPRSKHHSLQGMTDNVSSRLNLDMRKNSSASLRATPIKNGIPRKDQNGNRIINDYIVIRELGKGSFARVQLIQHIQTKKLFAMKVLRRQVLGDDDRDDLLGSLKGNCMKDEDDVTNERPQAPPKLANPRGFDWPPVNESIAYDQNSVKTKSEVQKSHHSILSDNRSELVIVDGRHAMSSAELLPGTVPRCFVSDWYISNLYHQSDDEKNDINSNINVKKGERLSISTIDNQSSTRIHSISDELQYFPKIPPTIGTTSQSSLSSGMGRLGEQKSMEFSTFSVNSYSFQRTIVHPPRVTVMESLREIAVLKLINHNNVVKLEEVIDDMDGNKVFLIMEYLEGGSLPQFGSKQDGSYDRSLHYRYFTDILAGLLHIHSLMLYHQDIKPANCLISGDGNAKIADFGTCDSRHRVRVTKGTPAYTCPELILNCEVDGSVADAWAFAVTMYQTASGEFPFKKESWGAFHADVTSDAPVVISDKIEDPMLRDLLAKMLSKDLRTRYNLFQAANHPYFRGGSMIDQGPAIVQARLGCFPNYAFYEGCVYEEQYSRKDCLIMMVPQRNSISISSPFNFTTYENRMSLSRNILFNEASCINGNCMYESIHNCQRTDSNVADLLMSDSENTLPFIPNRLSRRNTDKSDANQDQYTEGPSMTCSTDSTVSAIGSPLHE